jgi:DNA-binding transcriptional LysR family regulator
MELHQIRFLLAIIREGNFSRAAAACNVSQPSITRAIRKLEYELGGLIFDRRPGNLELTQLGHLIVPGLQRISADVDETVRTARMVNTTKRHLLRVGLMCTLGPVRWYFIAAARIKA